MIEKNRETNLCHAVCDCRFEYSDKYNGFHECSHSKGWHQPLEEK